MSNSSSYSYVWKFLKSYENLIQAYMQYMDWTNTEEEKKNWTQ